jgi:mRNA-degrading endonuclease toxin of MazEF toxin-antitoxin module
VKRGELYRVHKPGGDPKSHRTFVVVSRQVLIESKFSTVICAPVFTHGRTIDSGLDWARRRIEALKLDHV